MRSRVRRAPLAAPGKSLCGGGWCVGSEDVPAVGTSGLGGAVGVQDELPAAAVNAHVVVELADQSKVFGGSLAAVLLMAQVVDVAVDRGAAAPGPGAAFVAQQHGAADVGRDAVAVADVQRERGGVVRLVEQPVAED